MYVKEKERGDLQCSPLSGQPDRCCLVCVGERMKDELTKRKKRGWVYFHHTKNSLNGVEN